VKTVYKDRIVPKTVYKDRIVEKVVKEPCVCEENSVEPEKSITEKLKNPFVIGGAVAGLIIGKLF
jgi:hypothetical protein